MQKVLVVVEGHSELNALPACYLLYLISGFCREGKGLNHSCVCSS